MRSESVSSILGRAVRELSAKTAKVANPLHFLWKPIIRHFRRRQALAELRGLDACTLKDVGLHRGEIWFIADAYARGVPYRPLYTPSSRERVYHCE